MNNKRNNGLQGHYCDVIRGHCFVLTIVLVPIAATMCPNDDFSFRSGVTMAPDHAGCLVPTTDIRGGTRNMSFAHART
jgi:hypothetical protein